MSEPSRIPELVRLFRAGDRDALDETVALVYNELRLIASRHLRKEISCRPMQTTELVHEAYIRLVGAEQLNWQDRAHLLAVASRVIRHILLDQARAKLSQKRGADMLQLDSMDNIPEPAPNVDILALDAALDRLEDLDPESARIVELRFFSGLTIPETAHVTGLSESTVLRNWNTSKRWLFRQLRSAAEGKGVARGSA